ncbi:NUDIX hydrolase [Coralliovum pocilloporae]|uniref:NUDIX hydrolase n=1 Tax=Coralliovum pocilloporae TaxID=3066369 RepID=UPI003306A5B4
MTKDVRVLKRELLHEGDGRLERVRYGFERRDGTAVEIEEDYLHYGHSVGVLPIDRNRGTVLVIRQVRVPVLFEGDGSWILETCAGMIEADDVDRTAAVRREALEELGYRISNPEEIGRVFLTPGCVSERIGLFLADYTPDDRETGGGGVDAEGEDVEVIEMPFADLARLAKEGRIQDASLLMLTQAVMLRYPELWT